MGIIAIFGGTFNPIHIGHSEIIRYLSQNVSIEKVVLVPTNIPPHKEADLLAASEDRLNMCKIVASNYSNVEVSDIELKRMGKSYTVDTVYEFKKMYPDKDIAITVGADMIVSFDTWKNYLNIIKNCYIIAFKRAGISVDEYYAGIDKLKLLNAKIIEIPYSITDISSTQVRNNLLSITKDNTVLDTDVRDYIFKNGLYGV